MTGPEKRAWMYGLAWLGGGVACGGALAWLIWIMAHKAGWAVGTEGQRLGILGDIATGLLILMGLVMLGLTMRNAIRNLKGSAGPLNFDASGKESEE